MGSETSFAGNADLSLRERLRALYDDYAACIDDLQLDLWPAFFVDDAVYRVTSRANHIRSLGLSEIYCDGIGMIRDRASAIRETTVYVVRPHRHFVSGVRILGVEGQIIKATANFAILEAPQDAEARVLMIGRYVDRLIDNEGNLRFAERCCIYDNYRINTSLLFPV
jgi:anthranilate 1,2-dioxygenase small subunit